MSKMRGGVAGRWALGKKQLCPKRLPAAAAAACSWQWSPTNIYTQEDAQVLTRVVQLEARAGSGGWKPAAAPTRHPGKTARFQPGGGSKEHRTAISTIWICAGLKAGRRQSGGQLHPKLCGSLHHVIDVALVDKNPAQGRPGITRPPT